MRRISSFIARRVDKPDAPSTTSSNDTDPLPQDPIKRKTRALNSLSRKLAPSFRPHLLASDSAYSSSSASSGSAELRTPDEEVLLRTLSQRGSWKSWLGAKKQRNEDLKAAAACMPPFPTTPIALRPPPRFNDTDDTSSELEDDLPVPSITDKMRAMILNGSVDPPSSPPLLDIPGSSPFPRSCLRSSHIRRRNTLESKLHNTMLLHKLNSLSPAEERSIICLGARPIILVKEAQAHDPNIDAYPEARLLRRSSASVGDWMDRPCFEDRVQVWTRQEPSGQIVSADVAGSPYFGVAALEFSEQLQKLAGFEPEPSQTDSGTAIVSNAPVAPAVDYISPKQEQAKPEPRVKRGVRFAEDGKDDQIPLGYVLRIKKRREEKARFLREEREKRELEEKTRIREEQHQSRLLEAEKGKQEKEQKAFELQKKKMEEERRRQNYATELQASRTRREASRAGHISSSSSLVRDIERDRSASRDARPSALRTIDLMVPAQNLSLYDGSPASSMPATPQGSQRSFSRPPSIYSSHTTSSEDVRARDGRHISRHSTLAFDPSKQYPLPLPNHHPSFLPYNFWTNVQAPPVPPMMTSMPFYSMDIPLLPPSPPFMMNQSGYRQRPTNSQGQLSSVQHNSSSNHTTEGIRRTSRAAPNSSGAFHTHQRRASDEARGHSSSANVLPDRRYGSQTDLQGKRSYHVAHSSRGSNLHHSHHPPALLHSHTSPAMPVSTSQSRPTPNRRQSVYS